MVWQPVDLIRIKRLWCLSSVSGARTQKIDRFLTVRPEIGRSLRRSDRLSPHARKPWFDS